MSDSPYTAPFFNDSIKVNQKLTLNLGIRWDYWHARAALRGNQATFDPRIGKAIAGEKPDGTVDLTAQPVAQALGRVFQGPLGARLRSGRAPRAVRPQGRNLAAPGPRLAAYRRVEPGRPGRLRHLPLRNRQRESRRFRHHRPALTGTSSPINLLESFQPELGDRIPRRPESLPRPHRWSDRHGISRFRPRTNGTRRSRHPCRAIPR